ncbi:MAG: hypothetical protein LBL26_09600, partial [Peptococcaceae bacterium]|nr:hypothetical protein [Peptococcaceae bacterium]
LAARENDIFRGTGVNGQHRAGILPAAVIAMAGVNEIAIFLDDDLYRAAHAFSMNVFHKYDHSFQILFAGHPNLSDAYSRHSR